MHNAQNLNKENIMKNLLPKTQVVCLSLFLVLAGVVTYATDNGVAKCNTVFTQHLVKAEGQCK